MSKVLVILCFIAVARSYENENSDHNEQVAYSSVYTAFGNSREDTNSSNHAKTNEPDNSDKLSITSAPVYESSTYEERNSKINDEIFQHERKEETVINPEGLDYFIPSIQSPTEQSVPSLKQNAIFSSDSTAPAEAKSSSPPFSSAILSPSRLITPGLSAFATSDSNKQATLDLDINESKSPSQANTQSAVDNVVSHASFEGIGVNYSW